MHVQLLYHIGACSITHSFTRKYRVVVRFPNTYGNVFCADGSVGLDVLFDDSSNLVSTQSELAAAIDMRTERTYLPLFVIAPANDCLRCARISS